MGSVMITGGATISGAQALTVKHRFWRRGPRCNHGGKIGHISIAEPHFRYCCSVWDAVARAHFYNCKNCKIELLGY